MIILHITGCIADELRERGDAGGLVPHDPGLVQRARVSLVRNDRHLLNLACRALLSAGMLTGGSANVQLAASDNSATACSAGKDNQHPQLAGSPGTFRRDTVGRR